MLGLVLFLAVGVGLALHRKAVAVDRKQILFALGFIVLFVPLPLLRFFLSQNILETAQGRHLLFPSLLPLTFLIVVGLGGWFKRRGSLAALLALAIFFGGILTLIVWPRITFAGTPYFPVKSELDHTPEITTEVEFAGEIRLLGLDRPAERHPLAVPLTLIWQARKVPGVDYTVRLELYDESDAVVGLWQGQRDNGRLPTRSWDKGDVVYHTVWMPVLPGTPTGDYTLTLQLIDQAMHPVPTDQADRGSVLRYADLLTFTGGDETSSSVTLFPRGDRLDKSDPYRYRSTMAAVIRTDKGTTQAVLTDPTGHP
jgi:hypothetical protein